VRRTALIASLAAAIAIAYSAVAGGDSFTPVRLAINIAPVGRLHQPLKVSVDVSADASVLDNATGPLRIRVKLCTAAAARYDTARRLHARARTIKADRRAARRACGPGVPL
jgi:hypothetical protein